MGTGINPEMLFDFSVYMGVLFEGNGIFGHAFLSWCVMVVEPVKVLSFLFGKLQTV